MRREVDAVNDLSFLVRQERHTALLAALDALVQDMATISGVHGVPHADASEPAMKATAYWQGRLDGLLREHREGPRSP